MPDFDIPLEKALNINIHHFVMLALGWSVRPLWCGGWMPGFCIFPEKKKLALKTSATITKKERIAEEEKKIPQEVNVKKEEEPKLFSREPVPAPKAVKTPSRAVGSLCKQFELKARVSAS